VGGALHGEPEDVHVRRAVLRVKRRREGRVGTEKQKEKKNEGKLYRRT